MNVWVRSLLLSLVWIGIIILGIFLIFRPGFRNVEAKAYPSPNEGELIGLEKWHQNKFGDLHFMLVHGMKHHPLGSQKGAKLPDIALPNFAGLLNYEDFSDALGYWEEYDRKWWEPTGSQLAWWQKSENQGLNDLKKNYYEKHEIGFDKTRNEITRLAVQENYNDFIVKYCKESGYTLPPQLAAMEKNPQVELTPISYFKGEDNDGGFSAPGDQEVPFHVLKKDYHALGFLFRLTAKKADHPDIHFHVACWNVKSCVIKESVFGSWDHFNKDKIKELNAIRNEVDPGGAHLMGDGGIISGITGDYEEIVDKHRNTLHRLAKAHYINWGFGDASIYMKPHGYLFEWAIADAFCAMAGELKPDDRLAIVTESLGSAVVLNTINYMLASYKTMGSTGFRIRHTSFPLYVDPNKPDIYRVRAEKERYRKLESLHNLFDFFAPDRNGSAKEKVAVYMFANQFGMIQAAAERSQYYRLGDFSQSLNEALDYLDSSSDGLEGSFLNRINEVKMTNAKSPYLTIAMEDVLASALGDRVNDLSEGEKADIVEKMSDKLIPDYMRQKVDGPRECLSTLARSGQADQIVIASFHDPDDLLGFPLPDSGSEIKVFNYYVKNAGWTARLKLNGENISIKDPGGAHTKFETNPIVLDLMYRGSESEAAKAFAK